LSDSAPPAKAASGATSFVSGGCQNPTLTIMALAVHGCDHLMAEMKKGKYLAVDRLCKAAFPQSQEKPLAISRTLREALERSVFGDAILATNGATLDRRARSDRGAFPNVDDRRRSLIARSP
jgi:hypothetical protein